MDVKLQWLWDALAPWLPPALGAFIGLRYRREGEGGPQRNRDKVVSWACAMGAGIYLGAMIGKRYDLSFEEVGGAMFLIAMLASELFAVLIYGVRDVVLATFRQWAADPVGTFKRWRDAWLGRG